MLPGMIAGKVAVVLLSLVWQAGIARGVTCPQRVSYQPDESLGGLWSMGDVMIDPGTQIATTNYVGQPTEFFSDCCPVGRIASWAVSATKEYQFLGKLTATCTDGTVLQTMFNVTTGLTQFGHNGTLGDGSEWIANNAFPNGTIGTVGSDPVKGGLLDNVTVIQPDNEGVFSYDANGYTINSFLGVGAAQGNEIGAFSCPTGTRAIGFGSRSGCYSLVDLKVVCAQTNSSQDNTGPALQTNPQCSQQSNPYTAIPSPPYDPANDFGNPLAWNYTADPNNPLYSAAAGNVTCDTCSNGEAIANWTVAFSNPGHGSGYIGLVQGQCTDGELLTPIKYGFNGTYSGVCRQQEIVNPSYFYTPSPRFQIANSQSSGVGTLATFIVGTAADNIATITCPDGQQAVGYSARSACYSLAEFRVLCANSSSFSSKTQSALQSFASYTPSSTGSPSLPHLAEPGLCPNGAFFQPNNSYAQVKNTQPIGRVGAWSENHQGSALELNKHNLSDINIAPSGVLQSQCCPKGQAIKSFQIWPTNNYQNIVGQLQAYCTKDGKSTQSTGLISFGFNGTYQNGTTAMCNNSLLTPSTKDIPSDGFVTYQASYGFETLLGWPVRNTAVDVGNPSDPANLTCGAGYWPVGFSARSSCLSLSDFRVICGPESDVAWFSAQASGKVQNPNSGLSAGAIAGVAVGAFFGVAFVSLVAGLLLYRRRQEIRKKTHIESRALFMGGPEGFYTAGYDSSDSRHSSIELNKLHLISTGQMTIEHIGQADDLSPALFEQIPAEWEIKSSEIKLHCVSGKPIELGRGGFGVVLYATVHKEDAAVKLIPGRDRKSQAKILQEITIMERARTDYVVRFLGYSVCQDGILLAMEYMAGGNLWQALRQDDEFQWYGRGCQAMRDVAKGLFVLHRNRIAHLDLKTPNILISETGRCKISDLGLGRLLEGEQTAQTALGTWFYMSPEAISGFVGLPSDIYSLGIILWEVCTLMKPTRDIWGTAEVRVPEDAPQAVLDLIHACLQQDPKARPTAGEVCDALDKIQTDQMQAQMKLVSPDDFQP